MANVGHRRGGVSWGVFGKGLRGNHTCTVFNGLTHAWVGVRVVDGRARAQGVDAASEYMRFPDHPPRARSAGNSPARARPLARAASASRLSAPHSHPSQRTSPPSAAWETASRFSSLPSASCATRPRRPRRSGSGSPSSSPRGSTPRRSSTPSRSPRPARQARRQGLEGQGCFRGEEVGSTGRGGGPSLTRIGGIGSSWE